MLLGIPWWPSGQDSALPLQGAQVRSMVGELRSHVLCSVAKKIFFLNMRCSCPHGSMFCSFIPAADMGRGVPLSSLGASRTQVERLSQNIRQQKHACVPAQACRQKQVRLLIPAGKETCPVGSGPMSPATCSYKTGCVSTSLPQCS